MEPAESLRSLSEVAIALTGFTGIVAVLGERAGGQWTPLEWIRLRMLLETSLAVLFLSLAPVLLQHLASLHASLWRLCNALQAAVHVLGGVVIFARVRRLDPSEWIPEERRMASVLGPLSATLIAAQLGSALGGFSVDPFFLYYLGLLYLLALSALHFVLLLVPESG